MSHFEDNDGWFDGRFNISVPGNRGERSKSSACSLLKTCEVNKLIFMAKAGKNRNGKKGVRNNDDSPDLFDNPAKRVREDVPPQDQRELCYDSLGICGKPGCSQKLNIRTPQTGALTTVGEMAHIIAAQDNGRRGDPAFAPGFRERYGNLILLCRICHAEVDNPANYAIYPAAVLREWKIALQARRRSAVARSRENPEIKDLAALLNGLATAAPIITDNFDRTDLRNKIQVNGLSPNVESTISRNVHYVSMVSRQIELEERIRPTYGELIEARMGAEWLSLSDQGIESDAAFMSLKDMMMFNSGQVGSEAIVEMVLAYFFERCTILHRS